MELQHEKVLLTRLKKSDELAFRELYDHHYPLMTRIAFRYLKSDDKSRDIAQDAFVEIWNRRENLELRLGLKPYLARTVVNKCLSFLRKEKRIDFSAPENMPELVNFESADQTLEAKELETSLRSAILALPDRCRTIFNLSRSEGKSHQEIADELGISKKTIENQMTKALKHLRNVLQEHRLQNWSILFFLVGIGATLLSFVIRLQS